MNFRTGSKWLQKRGVILTVNSLIEAINKRNMDDGINRTGLPYVNVCLTSDKSIEMPQTDNTYLFLVVEGTLRLYTPSGIMDYESVQYSVSAIDTPETGYVLAISDGRRFSAISVEFNPSDVIGILLELDGELIENISKGELSDEVMRAADKKVIDCICRLLEIADDPVSRDFLGNTARKEMIFHVLCGSAGSNFLQSIIRLQNSDDIYAANTWIKENYKQAFTVEELAKKFNMSVSVFHDKFRSAVGMAPLQCQKRLRLTEARRLMMDDNSNVSEAASEVGYDNYSQFIREYKKMFGLPPKDDIRRIRSLSDE